MNKFFARLPKRWLEHGPALVLAALLLSFGTSSFAQPKVPGAPSLGADSYILIDFHSNTTIAEHDADKHVEPASITKLMTSYVVFGELASGRDRKSTRLNSSHVAISYAVFCLKKKTT